jgi:hypothetical protein
MIFKLVATNEKTLVDFWKLFYIFRVHFIPKKLFGQKLKLVWHSLCFCFRFDKEPCIGIRLQIPCCVVVVKKLAAPYYDLI